METLEKSRMCRLCGKHSGIAIDIFDKTENHMRKINAILPILVHEMDLLPKQMCHRCSYKLEEFYNFYVDCAKTDTELKSQLSWMRKENLEEKIVTPMVKMNKFKIKTEPPDNDDTIDSNNVLGCISENSLLFPASILQHSFESGTGSTLPCSHCRCICNRSIKINKNSLEQMKVTKNIESESQISDSNVISNISDKVNEINKSKSIDKNFTINKNIFEDKNLKKKNIKDILNVHHVTNDCNKSSNIHNDILKSEKLSRALRPRKGSVDYMGQKKKGIDSNLKTKFKNKLDIFETSSINLVDIKLSQGSSIHSSPIIKLQKVDDAMKTLRTRKNLQEFNRRIKEFKRKQSWKRDDQNIKIIHRKENLNRKILQQEVNQHEKNVHKEENQKRRNLQTEETLNKKNVLNEGNEKNEQYLISMMNKTNENVMRVMELKIKQEVINKAPGNEFSEQLIQETSFDVNHLKGQKICESIDRYPLCAVVKLEKDYTCNVDYPRIKIKRHLAVSNPVKSENGPLDASMGKTSIFELSVNSKPCIKNETNFSPKNLRSKERGLKLKNKRNKSEKVLRKKNKKLDLVKQILLEKSSSVVSQTDLKRYCEQCDTCFKNKELYKLHPCYQK